MLVLSRQIGEAAIINPGPDQIIVKILDVKGRKVRLGIEADKSMPVHRAELLDNDRTPRQRFDRLLPEEE